MDKIKNNNIRSLLDKFAFNENDNLTYQINHEIFDDELYMVYDEKGIITLGFTRYQYLIPVFSDYAAIEYTLEYLKDHYLNVEIATGEKILSDHFGDSNFFGLAINPPNYDYVLSCNNFVEVQ